MSESKRRKPFTREDVAANIATCRACWTPDTQAVMSEDAASGQLERRRSSGVATVPIPCRSAYRFWAAQASQ
jgi:hypothetical protein